MNLTLSTAFQYLSVLFINRPTATLVSSVYCLLYPLTELISPWIFLDKLWLVVLIKIINFEQHHLLATLIWYDDFRKIGGQKLTQTDSLFSVPTNTSTCYCPVISFTWSHLCWGLLYYNFIIYIKTLINLIRQINQEYFYIFLINFFIYLVC